MQGHAPPRRLEPIGWPARWLRFGVIAVTLATAWAGLAVYHELLAVIERQFTYPPLSMLVERNARVGDAMSLAVVTWLVTLTMLPIWLYRAWTNVARRGANGRLSAGQAVALWFIPGVNLVASYVVLAALWRGSDVDASHRGVPRPVALWWALHTTAVLTVAAVLWLRPPDITATGWLIADVALVAATLFEVAAGVAFFHITTRITSMQQHLLDAEAGVGRDELWASMRGVGS